MQKLGFSDTLGAFAAGVLLSETNFRTQVSPCNYHIAARPRPAKQHLQHAAGCQDLPSDLTEGRVQVEADIKPFRGMLLGLFFVSTGASLDVKLMLHEPWIVIALLGGLLAVKVGIIGSLAPFFGLNKCAAAPALAHAQQFSQSAHGSCGV